MSDADTNIKIFRYNMSIYYQSTIIYFVAAIIYMVIRGEFVEDSFKLVFKDPIIYFFAFIVLISIISLLYNLYKNKHLEINTDSIAFVNRFRTRKFNLKDISNIKISAAKRQNGNRAFRLIRIKLINRRRPIILRPYDYENENLLIETMQNLKRS
ncbi:MAG: hypothetical protein IPM56_11675 [Ignavibacteriales bacterium]|nr:MAG: hypothetical protein IPM56_11675 [Ignavibacteriales bacterium]